MANKNVKLRATQGADEANVNGVSYRPGKDGTIEVPTEAVAHLTGVAGFVAVDPDDERISVKQVFVTQDGKEFDSREKAAEWLVELDSKDDRVKVVHDSAVSCSWNGQTFERHEDGKFRVPAAAVVDLSSHGFVALEESVEPAPAKADVKVPQLNIPK